MNDSQNLKSILNHMGDTGIYVIRQDNHQILYYNDKIKQVTPEVEIGMVCNEVWDGSCRTCPLIDMGDKESNTSINYDDPFGKVVDICATKMVWEGDIPACLISVSKHVESVAERQLTIENRQLAVALTQAYPMIISVNLTRNSYYMVEYDRFDTKKAPTEGVFDELIDIGTATMHPDFKQRFHDTFNRHHLLELFSSGEKEVYMEHRQLGDDGQYHWTDTHVIKVDNPYNDEILEISLSKNIDQQKRNEELLQNSLDVACRNAGGMICQFLVGDDYIHLQEVSQDFHDFFGLGANTGINADMIASLSPVSAETYIHEICSMGKERKTINREIPYIKDGRTYWLRIQSSCIGEQAGFPLYFSSVVDITSQKQLELEREATYNSLPGGIAKVAIDDMFTLVEANDTLFTMCDLSPEDFADGYISVIYEPDRKRVSDTVRKQDAENRPIYIEYRLVTRNKEIRWVHVEGRRVGDWHGYHLYLTVVLDITERKKAEGELEQEQLRYRIAVESSTDVLFEYSLSNDTFTMFPSSRKNELMQKGQKVSIPRFLTDMAKRSQIHPDDINKLKRTLRGEQPRCEIRYRQYESPDIEPEDYGWISFQGDVVWEEGKVIRVIGTIRDIDKFKKTEDNSLYFQQICNFISNRDYQILATIDVRTGQYHVTYFSPDTMYAGSSTDGMYLDKLERFVSNFVAPEDRTMVTSSFQLDNVLHELDTSGKEYSVYYRSLEPDGGFRWKSMSFAYFNEDRNTILMSGRDIQEIQDAKVKEEIANQSLNVALDRIYDEVFYINLSRSRLESVRSRDTYSLSFDIENDRIVASVHPDDREVFRQKIQHQHLLDAFGQGEASVYVEARIMAKDGKYHWTALNIVHMGNLPDGDIMALALLSTIDERKQMEQEREEFFTGITALFEECVSLNATKDTYSLRRIIDNSWETIPEQGDFDRNNDLYCRTLIHPDDQQLFRDAFSLESIRREFGAKHVQRIQREFRRKLSDGAYHWVEMIAVRLENLLDDDLKVVLVFRDIDELRQAQEEQRNANQRFAVTVNSLYNAIYEGNLLTGAFFIWEADGESLARRPDTQTGLEFFERMSNDVIHPDYQADYRRLFNNDALRTAYQEGRQEVYFEAPQKMEDGSYRWYSIQLQFLSKKNANDLTYMIYMKDLDDSKREIEEKRQALVDALALAEHANRAKTDFLSRMSHDIRTPMNAIIGMTMIASAEIDDKAKVQAALGKIGVSAKFLLSLINDVLDMSKIESGKMHISQVPFEFGTFIQDIATVTETQALEKHQEFSVSISDQVGSEYIGDPLRLNQILMNLLGNAVKYTNIGGWISLRVSILDRKGPLDMVRFEIEDNGIGMSPEFLQKMFDPFEQMENPLGKVSEGTGLGLSITKNLVHLMHGKIVVTSELGKGSLFSVELPLELSSRVVLPSDNAEDSRLSILVVDDDQETCTNIVRLLKDTGAKTQWTISPRQALDLVRQSVETGERYDVLFVDWKMPEVDGLDLVRAIRRITGTELQIVFISSFDWSDIKTEAKLEGVDMFLAKPVTRQNLSQIVYQIRKVRQEQALKTKSKDYVFNHEHILLVEDNEINMEIAQTLLEMRGFVIEKAENGKIAVDMFAASDLYHYQVVLMDIRMPVMDGVEATKVIRKLDRPDAKAVPIVAMTANAFVEEMDYAKQAGVSDYITKPIDTDILFSVLYRVLYQKPAE